MVPLPLLPALWQATHHRDRNGEPDRIAAAIRFAICTGLRKSEITHLRWEEVDLQHKLIRLAPSRTKNKRGLVLPLSDLAMQVLYTMAYDFPFDEVFRRSGFVFGRQTGMNIRIFHEEVGLRRKPIRREELELAGDLPCGDPNDLLTKLAAEVGCTKRITMHALRKTHATIAERAVGLIRTEMLLNHSPGRDVTVRNYLIPDEDELRRWRLLSRRTRRSLRVQLRPCRRCGISCDGVVSHHSLH